MRSRYIIIIINNNNSGAPTGRTGVRVIERTWQKHLLHQLRLNPSTNMSDLSGLSHHPASESLLRFITHKSAAVGGETECVYVSVCVCVCVVYEKMVKDWSSFFFKDKYRCLSYQQLIFCTNIHNFTSDHFYANRSLQCFVCMYVEHLYGTLKLHSDAKSEKCFKVSRSFRQTDQFIFKI